MGVMGTIDASKDVSFQLDNVLTASGSSSSLGMMMSMEKSVSSGEKSCQYCWGVIIVGLKWEKVRIICYGNNTS